LETLELLWLHHPQTPARSSTSEAGDMVPCLRLMFTTVKNHTSPTLVNVVSCRRFEDT